MIRWTIVAAALLAVLSARAARADDAPYVLPEFLTAPPNLPPGADPAAVWRLDLAEALQLAMRRNLNVVIEKQSVRAASLAITVAGGPFEPTLTANYTHVHQHTPPVIAQQGMIGQLFDSSEDDWSAGLSQKLQSGTLLSVNFFNARLSSSFGTAVEPLNYTSTLSFGVSQPLLRGFSRDLAIPRVELLKARISSERERQQLAVVATDVVERTEVAYWDLVEALHRYEVDLQSKKRAEDQLALTRRQIDAGTLPPGDMIPAESTLAQRQLAVVQSEENVNATADRLRAMMNLPRDQWSRPILPVDVPRFVPDATSPEDALALAIKHRPELAQAALDLQSAALSVRKADNDKLPQVDLSLSATLFGEDASYATALNQVANANGNTWTAAVNMTWTPLRRATSAAAEIQRVQHQVLSAQREQRVQDIWFQVRDAVRNLRSADRQVHAAAKSRELAGKTLELEERRFANGQSSNFFIGQRQGELAAAQVAELSAVLAHAKASAALLRATGRLLAERNVELVVAKP
jgi:outer membrane protein TolC